MIDEALRDAQHGLQRWRARPMFAMAAILTIALSTGAATAFFSLVDGVLLKPLPYPKGERLVAITFIQSRIQDPFRRNLLFELNEVAALEGLKMSEENFGRMQLVQQNLLRYWSDMP